MDPTTLGLLLADYEERNADYRRQVDYYAQIVSTVVAILVVVLGWTLFSSGGRRPLWLLPVGLVFIEIAGLLALFVHRSSRHMLSYLLRIEQSIDRLCRPPGAPGRHLVDHVDPEGLPSLAFGFHVARLTGRMARPVDHATRRLAAASLAFGGGLLLVATWGFLRTPFYETPLENTLAVAVVGLPPLGGGLLLHLYRRKSRAEIRTILEDETRGAHGHVPDTDGQAIARVLEVDFKQRNADFRFLADYYPRLFFWLLSATTPLAALLATSEPESGWVYLAWPPLLCAFGVGGLLVWRKVKGVKRYLAETELEMERTCAGRIAPVHEIGARRGGDGGPFLFGFFRLVREKHFQRTGGAVMPWRLTVLNVMAVAALLWVVVVCAWRAHDWIAREHPDLRWIALVNPVFVGGMLAGILVLFLKWRRAGRHAPRRVP